MSGNRFIVCLFFLFIVEVRSHVCTRSITKLVSKFVLSPCKYPDCYDTARLKNFTTWEPVRHILPMCCPGYCILDPNEPPSSDNCPRICKIDCTTEACQIKEKCFESGIYIQEKRASLCQPRCSSEKIYVIGTCQPEQNDSCANGNCIPTETSNKDLIQNDSLYVPIKKTDFANVNETRKCTPSANCTDISMNGNNSSGGSSLMFLYTSVVLNIILIIIIAIIMYKIRGVYNWFGGSGRNNKEDTLPNVNQGYLDMRAAVTNHRMKLPDFFKDVNAGCNVEEPLRYDYVHNIAKLSPDEPNYEEIPPSRG